MKQVIGEADGAVQGRYLPGSFSADHGSAATRELLTTGEAPTAIVCGGNQLLLGCLRVIQERDLEVGRDISVVTCDDVALSALYRPPIASISRDTVAIGRTAAELLLKRLAGESTPENVVLPTMFTARASAARPPA